MISNGKRFGKLTVVDCDFIDNDTKQHFVVCRCDCGNIIKLKSYKLLQSNKPVRSCGCLRLEAIHDIKTIHGESGGKLVGERTKLYRVWSNMKSRCYNQNVRSYKDYGAKGIGVCEQWKNDFVSFRNWANTHGYNEKLTIDRIDSSKDYCPENCRWITASENSIRAHEKACWGFNLKTQQYVEFVNIRKFAKLYNLSYSCIDRVLHKRNKTHKNWIFGYII